MLDRHSRSKNDPVTDALLLASSVGHAGLLLWIVGGSDRSRKMRWLAALSADFFAWTLVTYFNHRERSEFATALDAALNALAVPLTLQFVAARVGASRAFRFVATFVGSFYVGMALSSLGAFAAERRDWVASSTWTNALLVGLVTTVAMVTGALVQASRNEPDRRERGQLARTGAAFLIGGSGLGLELLTDLGAPLPVMSAPALLIATVLLALAAVRSGGAARRYLALAIIVSLGALVSVVLYSVFRRYGTSATAAGILVVAIVLLFVFLARAFGLSMAVTRERQRELAHAGQMTAQMLHDLRTPLAALTGAMDILDGTDVNPTLRAEMLALARAQTARLVAMVETYGRTLRIELRKVEFDVLSLTEGVVKAFRATVDEERIHIVLDQTAPLAKVDGDPDLLASCLENLLRNAKEAMSKEGGHISISITDRERTSNPFVVLSVRDDGVGMDDDVRSKATSDFYTTKESGSGLGLSFVQRVAEAHGGNIVIESRKASGTTVEVWLPRAAAPRAR